MITALRQSRTGDILSASYDNEFMNVKVILVAAALALFPSLLGGLAWAHEFETGHIERSVDVIVRGQDVQVKYSLGLADETIVNWLVAEGELEKETESRYRKCIADLESQLAAMKKPEKPGQQKVKVKPQTAGAKAVPAEPLAFQTELMELLREKLSGSVCKNLQLTIDGKQLEFTESTVSSSARHNVAIEIELAAKLPTKSTTVLSLTDRNFLNTDNVATEQPTKSTAAVEESRELQQKFLYFGNVRLACRVKGIAVQLNSNVAPVLARAKPVDLATATFEERVQAATIRTKIGFAKPVPR